MFFQQRWSYKTGNIIISSPSYDSEQVYVGSRDGMMYAINKLSGQLAWKYNTIPDGGTKIDGSPVAVNGVVFFGSDNRMYAVNAKTGILKWKTPPGPPYSSSPVVITKQGGIYHAAISGMKN